MLNILQIFADWVTYSVLGLVQGSPLASSVNFFVYDVIWVSLLLAVVVFGVAIVRTFITPQKVKKWVAGRSEGVGNVIAALLGIPTPFCSCSAVPLFIGFVESGVPLGITFSFLIASPLINEVAAAMLLAMFGWQIALIYIVSGLIIAIVAGIIIGRLHLEGEVEEFVYKCKLHDQEEKPMTWRERVAVRYQRIKEYYPHRAALHRDRHRHRCGYPRVCPGGFPGQYRRSRIIRSPSRLRCS